MMRIAVGGLEHENSSFIQTPTPLATFLGRAQDGDELRTRGEANMVIDGLVRGVQRTGLDLVPLFYADAPSGGLPEAATYAYLKERLLAPLRAALPVDGVLLSLHGSFAAEGVDDVDGDILQAVRSIVGPTCPIMAVHDLHSNISPEMVAAATALIVERTYPHTDMAERGEDAAWLMARTLRGEIRPMMAARSLPMFWSAPAMITAEPPMEYAIDALASTLDTPGVLTASIAVGYQWVDSPIVGATTIVVTDGDAAAAQEHADTLARYLWERREMWQCQQLRPDTALDQGIAAGRYPIILADQADNTGGGAPGDSTEILRLFIERGLTDAAVLYVVDPETAAIAHHAGVGATVEVAVGGKSHPLLGPPVPMTAEVVALSDGRFVYDGPMWAGKPDNLGPSAWLRQNGVSVLVISAPGQPVDLAFPRSLGLDCRTLRYISVKSTGHFRSGFGPIAGSIANVDATGLLTQDFSRLPFTRLGRKMYPLQADAAIDWDTAWISVRNH